MNKIIIDYTETIEIQRNEETKHVVKEYSNIPLEVIKSIEVLMDNCRKDENT